ncbi:hypothetical protein HZH66_009537 [Vespula vulgaris]|uniref:Uncharacterized protein n=1 Tax=Vespula vulgaris TaxID=7454 RepID=A0A834JMV5_VESVU|nr:hypothetical protein HZH66_009537 [Vespula vulgaris]
MRDSAIQKNNKSLYTRPSFIRITGVYLYPSVVVRVRHEVEVLEKPEIPVVFERIRKAVEAVIISTFPEQEKRKKEKSSDNQGERRHHLDVAVENARFADSILSCLAKTTRLRRRGRHNGVKVRRRVEKREVEEEEEEKGVSNKTMTSRQSKDPVQKCHSDPGAGSTPGTSYSPTKRISRKQVPGISSSANTRKCVLTLDGYSYVIGK